MTEPSSWGNAYSKGPITLRQPRQKHLVWRQKALFMSYNSQPPASLRAGKSRQKLNAVSFAMHFCSTQPLTVANIRQHADCCCHSAVGPVEASSSPLGPTLLYADDSLRDSKLSSDQAALVWYKNTFSHTRLQKPPPVVQMRDRWCM